MSPVSTPILHLINASTFTGGSISPGGNVFVADGTNQTFTITPNAGYTIASVDVDGASVGTGSTYTFTGVAGDHTISATFNVAAGGTARNPAMVNVVLDAVVATLQQIDGVALGSRWLTKPAKVTRHHGANPYQGPWPLVIVTCTNWGPNDPMTSGIHRVQAGIEVRCLTQWDPNEMQDDPHRALHSLASDVISAIEGNWQLGGVLNTGGIHVADGYVANKELDQVAGSAECSVMFRAEWEWDYLKP